MKQLRNKKLSDILFIDIETASCERELKEGTPAYDAWVYKMKRSASEQDLDVNENYLDKAALYPEFARIVCISVGVFRDGVIKMTTYKDLDEKILLEKFNRDMTSFYKSNPKEVCLCGHAIKGFDIPFIFRRSLANRVMPCEMVDVGGAKPWELTALDTKELWKATGHYNASLVAVCLAMGVESSKSDINGSQVGEVYYNEGEAGLQRIVDYCERDVLATINVVLACRFEEQFDSYDIVEPKESEGRMDRIARTGEIEEQDYEFFESHAKGLSVDEKELMIRNLCGTLVVSGVEVPEDLQLKIMKA